MLYIKVVSISGFLAHEGALRVLLQVFTLGLAVYKRHNKEGGDVKSQFIPFHRIGRVLISRRRFSVTLVCSQSKALSQNLCKEDNYV